MCRPVFSAQGGTDEQREPDEDRERRPRERITDPRLGVGQKRYADDGERPPLSDGLARVGSPFGLPEPGHDRLAVVAGQEQSAWKGAVAIGVVLFVAAVIAIRAGGGWAALGWVLMAIVVLGAVGAVGSRITRR